jgi:hypothetical protein
VKISMDPQIYFFVEPRPIDFDNRLYIPPVYEQEFITKFRNAGYEVLVASDDKVHDLSHLAGITWNIGDSEFQWASSWQPGERPLFLVFYNNPPGPLQWDTIKYTFGNLLGLLYPEPRALRSSKIAEPKNQTCLVQPDWDGFEKGFDNTVGNFIIKQCR